MNPVLVEVWRGKVMESFHRGVICIVDRNGSVVYQAGDIRQVCYPRSALKFFQQIPLLLSGAAAEFGFSDEELAVMCGSHNGEEAHVRVVRSILGKIGLNEEALLCGAQYPSDRKSANRLIAEGTKAGPIHNNCSGKHAGMLALCQYRGYPTENYIDPQHPVQTEIRKIVAAFHDQNESEMPLALDGCSAPIYAFPVYHQALAYMRLVHPGFGDQSVRNACNRLITAVRKHPFMLAGSNRYCTDLVAHCESQLVGKTGAEGIYALAFHQTIHGVCIKIDDGKMQPQYNVAQKLVRQSGLFPAESLEALESYEYTPIQNFRKLETGHLKVPSQILEKSWL